MLCCDILKAAALFWYKDTLCKGENNLLQAFPNVCHSLQNTEYGSLMTARVYKQ
jgi:hypothetical protein